MMGGRESCLPKRGRSETERDYETNAYWGTYYDDRRAESEGGE